MTEREPPLSAMVAERGIKTSKDFVDFMSALMADLVENRIDSETVTAACRAGETMLKVVRMQREFCNDSSTPLQLSLKSDDVAARKGAAS